MAASSSREQMFEEQLKLGTEIINCVTNYGKRSTVDRQNITVVTNQLNRISEIYKTFLDNHAALNAIELDKADQSYFEDEYAEKIGSIYQKGLDRLLNDRKTIMDKIPVLNPWLTQSESTLSSAGKVDGVSQQKQSSTENGADIDVENTKKASTPIESQSQDPTFNQMKWSDMVNDESTAINQDIKKLVLQQRSIFFMLKEKFAKINGKDLNEFSSERIQLMINGISNLWDKAVDNHRKIFAMNSSFDARLPLDYSNNAYSDLEDQVEQTVAQLIAFKGENCELKNNTTNHSFSSKAPIQSLVNLPKLKIPEFAGDPVKFNYFKKLFIPLINSADISDAQKLYYLTSSFVGSASKHVQNVDLNLEPFSDVWKRVSDHFSDPRLLASAWANKLFSQKNVKDEDAAGLRSLLDDTKECLTNLKAEELGIDVSKCEFLIVFLLMKKLDDQSIKDFERFLPNTKDVPNLNIFYTFLDKQAQIYESLARKTKQHPKKVVNSTTITTPEKAKPAQKSNTATEVLCVICKQAHQIWECKKFLNYNTKGRWICIKRNRLCSVCFIKGHFGNDCVKPKCSICGSSHNKLLHFEKTSSDQSTKEETTGKVVLSLSKNIYINNIEQEHDAFVFLGTAIIYVYDNFGRKIECRAILDSCSQVNLITRSLSKKLGLPKMQRLTNILGVGDSKPCLSRECLSFLMSSVDGKFQKQISALVFHTLTQYQPSENVQLNVEGYELADPNFDCVGGIDILLGASIFPLLLSNNIVELGDGLPQLVQTVLGWVVMGVLSSEASLQSTICSVSLMDDDFQLNAPRLWDIDEPDESTSMSVEENMAIKVFDETTRRNKEGRFIVKLPKSKDPSLLGDSYFVALKRFKSLEKRIHADPLLFKNYYSFLNEYLQMGHMDRISLDDIPLNGRYFIPHHCVMKEDSSTTKLRVVFDASCRSSTEFSLNNILLKGPIVQCELFDLLIRFRLSRYAISADIEKMYRQVLVDEEDRNLQLILWRNDPSLPISVFRLNTVTYGTSSAPFLATNCLQYLSREYSNKFPTSSKILGQDFYVDDLITSIDSLDEAVQIQQELISMLASAGFHLRKWCSNDESLLKNVPDVDKEMQWSPNAGFGTVKTLGIVWNPREDQFSLKVSPISKTLPLTKRIISSESGSIFDPLGFVSPFVLLAKLIIQELWQYKLDWDAEVPTNITERWCDFRNQVEKLRKFSIPRHALLIDSKRIELHGFADASLKAYGAIVYLRSIDSNNKVQTSLLCSKSKVAPIGNVTIPKLELSGARLLVELVSRIKDLIRYKVDDIFFWCDSKVALCWISKDPGSFKPFVSNRVKKIQELSNPKQWHHIDGDQNPADIISRGMNVVDLMKSKLWFCGPSFLENDIKDWPCGEYGSESSSFEVCSELKKVTVHISTVDFDKSNFLEINHRNSFGTLQRVVGFIRRFAKLSKDNREKKESRKKRYFNIQGFDQRSLRRYVLRNVDHLSVDELNESIKSIVRFLQKEFSLEREMHRDLKTLVPFKDNDDIIRVGGRLHKSRLPFDSRHQMLLPKCKITKLLIHQIHLDNHHAGPNALLSFVRERFWPLDGKRLCSQVFYLCIPCFKCKPRELMQIMGDLPESRVSLTAPFTHTGIDYAGPFQIHYKLRGKRPSKVYLAVFICFAIKAVHLEIVSDLTTDAFLLCLKRFISRRGKPSEIWSDNATNFVGARQELLELKKFFENNHNQISGWTAKKGINWSTIPARSPHFGGLWEAAVKRAKFHLQHSVKNANLTFEELNTVVIEVESILNSRPLCPLSDNPNDFDPLTPNHFLISGNVDSIPDKDFSSCKGSLLRRYNLVCKLRAELSTDFHKFYLHHLQERKKWNKAISNIEENRLVLMKNKGVIGSKFEYGRVIKAIPGEDGYVRVVELKTPTGVRRRAITEIAPLPEDTDFEHPLRTTKKSVLKTTKTNSLTNILITMFLSFLMFPLILGNEFVNVTNFESHPGLYFDGVGKINIITDKWHLVTYFNMTHYLSQYSNLQNLMMRTKTLCNEDLCLKIVEQLGARMQNIEQLNMLIQEECQMREISRTHRIGKRSYNAPLNVIGNIAHSLFGTLDNEYADKMESTLSNVRSNEDRLLLLIQNHTTIIDQTVNIMKKNGEEISNHLSKLHSETIFLANTQKKESKKILFNALVSYMEMIMSEYRETQLQLHGMMKDFKKGRLNALLIKPEELEVHIREMERALGSNYKIPSVHYAELETISQVAVTHGKSCLIFQVEIPLLRRDAFDLYRLVPVPTFLKGKSQFIKPIEQYLAINIKSRIYYLLGVDEYNECEQFYDLKLCYQDQPMYPTGGDSHCEVSLFLGSKVIPSSCDLRYGEQDEYWISLYTINHWLFALKTETRVNVLCGESSKLQDTLTLVKEGIIEISSNCMLETNGVTIPGKSVVTSSLFLKKIPSILPELNITTDIKLDYAKKPLVVKLDNFDAISSAVAIAKNEEAITLKPLLFDDAPDIYHIISFGFSGGFLIFGILVCAYFFCCKKHNNNNQQTLF